CQAEDGIRDATVTGVQTCALPISFTPADRGAPVAIINETMARLLWPGQPAIGKCFIGPDKRCAEIMGVVPDARRFNAVEDASMRSEERRVGKESRDGWSQSEKRKK